MSAPLLTTCGYLLHEVIDDEVPAPREQIEHARLPVGTVEDVVLVMLSTER
jgi:hypothetical protein